MEALTELPWWMQAGISVGLFACTLIIGVSSFLSKWRAGNKPDALSSRLILEGGAIADMAPVHRANGFLERIAIAEENTAKAQIQLVAFLKDRFDAEQRRTEMETIMRKLVKEHRGDDS